MSPLATFKDLCVDAVDPARMGRFWAGALDLGYAERGDGLVQLTGRTRHHTVWVNPVPEPVTVKQRVHLDLHVASVDDVLALGATPYVVDRFRWQVLRDPEGGELCVFERDRLPDDRLYEIGVDSADPERMATWWADVLGARVVSDADDEGPWWTVEDIEGAPFEGLVFVAVPEPKTVKNRIHWDVDTSSVDALVAAGARVVRRPDADVSWTILVDPEGNEFCAFTD
ncbi:MULTISPECIES: VOC family protein [unclassified Nocardioides]|uniref:VOC family protein n=1 Tax=unclassified Nocardioides TaxID=2615069 RepID=UPI003015044A